MLQRWGAKPKDSRFQSDAAGDGTATSPPPEHDERRDAAWFDSSWELRKGLVVAEVTEADDLPAEWRAAAVGG